MSKSLWLRKVRIVTVEASATDPNAPGITGPADVAALARKMLPSDREGFAVMHLDSRGRVRSAEVVSIGSLNATIIHPREVFKAAILANANAVILAHNHPSGSALPSEEDIAVTDRLRDAGRILGIEVLDHVIVTERDYLSMRKGDE